MDQLVCFLSAFEIGWKHRRNGLKRGLLIDQQDIELLAHQLLEFGNRHVAVRLADAARQLKPTLVDCGAIHPDIDQAANDRRPQTASRNERLKLGNALLQKLAMQRIFGGLSQTLRPGGSTPTAA